MKFRIDLTGFAAEPTWTHEFDMASDAMALDYTERILVNSAAARNCLRAYLWNLDKQTMLGQFTFDKPTVTRC